MATLVLSGLGSAVGGEFGALAGAVLGRSIDNGFSGRGPRIKEDLSVQTAEYGRQIPRIYGHMRVGGSIIWATDLQYRTGVSVGKFGSSGTSYWANFAVALSSRTARRIRRIWADGRLLRGAGGDFKTATKFRFYTGDEDQSVDPLIASIEGLDFTPAFRGLAVAVFEEFQLADFGNRIPLLSFEIEADDDVPLVADIIKDVVGEEVSGNISNAAVQGFAAIGDDGASALSALAEVFGVEGLGTKRFHDLETDVQAISSSELGCTGGREVAVDEVRRLSSAKTANVVRLGYFDTEREFQASEQKIAWSSTERFELRQELAAALSASEAKSLAQASLARQWLKRETRTVRLPHRYLGLRPGMYVHLPNVGDLLVNRVRVEELVVIAECSRSEQLTTPALVASCGRSIGSVDVAAEPSELALLDLPAFDSAPSSAKLLVAGSGGTTPWRRLPVTIGTGSRDDWEVALDRRATIGRTQNNLAAGSSELIDLTNRVDVLLAGDDWLESCSTADMLDGANLALVGSELIQFGEALPLGGRIFRLRNLLRGRFGTEWACREHVSNERFVLLKPADFAQVDVPLSQIGALFTAEAKGLGDLDSPGRCELLFEGEALRPPSPVHLSAAYNGDGSLQLDWIRRSRRGYHWFDFNDAPLAEEQERYRVAIVGSLDRIEVTVDATTFVVPQALLTQLGGGFATIDVAQLGSALPSRPNSLQIRI